MSFEHIFLRPRAPCMEELPSYCDCLIARPPCAARCGNGFSPHLFFIDCVPGLIQFKEKPLILSIRFSQRLQNGTVQASHITPIKLVFKRTIKLLFPLLNCFQRCFMILQSKEYYKTSVVTHIVMSLLFIFQSAFYFSVCFLFFSLLFIFQEVGRVLARS